MHGRLLAVFFYPPVFCCSSFLTETSSTRKIWEIRMVQRCQTATGLTWKISQLLRCQPRQSVWSEWFGARGPADRTERSKRVWLGFSSGISASDSQGKRWGLASALAFLANVHLNRFRTYQFRPLEGIVEKFRGCCLMKPSLIYTSTICWRKP